jgi:hypothetical protein
MVLGEFGGIEGAGRLERVVKGAAGRTKGVVVRVAEGGEWGIGAVTGELRVSLW